MKKILGILMIACLLLAPTAMADPSPWTSADNYGAKASGKLFFGIKNLLLGWMDLFYEPSRMADAGDAWYAGAWKGIADAIVNEAGGAVHAVTFFIPLDVPLTDGGVNLNQ